MSMASGKVQATAGLNKTSTMRTRYLIAEDETSKSYSLFQIIRGVVGARV